MRWCLAPRQGFSIADLQPIAFGTYAEVLDIAETRYQALERAWHPDGIKMTPRWVRGTNLAIVPVGILPASKRRQAA